ncbi:MAG: hypothetical protein IKU04_08200 [Bacteroidales bacterium]|nr:hypothetical protein [Bacteroidales bacterium]
MFCAVLFAGLSAGLSAQTQSADEAKAEKEFYESVQKEIDRLSRLLDLDDAQVFYVDSILVHDYKAMQAEVKDLSDRKVSNVNMYYDVQDKWQESIYEAYHKVFDEDQWAKYLKNGAARDKKARDKRRAKAQR